MMSVKCNFQISWLQDPKFSKWLDKVPNDSNSAKCLLCLKQFSLSNMGRRAITSHMNSAKHIKNVAASEGTLGISFSNNSSLADVNGNDLAVESSSTIAECEKTPSIQSSDQSLLPKRSATLDKYKLRNEVTEAEILWCLNTVMNHSSLRGAESSVNLFSRMFPDSVIAKDMKLHKDKISYSLVYGLAYYFNNELKTSLGANNHYVIGFDESLNKVAQKSQMDLSVRYWDINTNSVKARYLTSVFLHKCNSVSLLHAFKLGIEGLDPSRLLQISMDGPNVNWSFYKLLKEDLKCVKPELDVPQPQLLEIGSCGLHIVHGAFKTAIKKTSWNVIEFLRAIYNLFKMVPSRRGLFIDITGTCIFPLPLCTVRWVENAKVAQRAQEVLPGIKKFVETVKENNNVPSCNSFKIIESSLKDKLLPAKLAYFQSFAEKLEPFLTCYQTDAPMVPFLFNDLQKLMKNVMSSFVKKEIVADDKFIMTDVFKKEDGLFVNLIPVKEIDPGYRTRSALKTCREVSHKENIEFRKNIRTGLQHFTLKLQERSPLKYPLCKYLSFLNPENVAADQGKACELMKASFDLMIQANQISPENAERADLEFRHLISKDHVKFVCENFKLNRDNPRLDNFWLNLVEEAENLRDIMKQIFLLSHGNATLERGFSINKEMIVENQREESLIAQRVIFDAIIDHGGMEKFCKQAIPTKLVHCMRNSYSRFKQAEDDRKKTMTEKDKRATEKRKQTLKLKELQAKKAKIMEQAQQELDVVTEEIKMLQ